MAIPGNLLSSTTESIDPNTSGWTTKLNCTISKGSGGRNGDGCLQVKSIASGEMQVRTVSSYPVVAGTVYQAFADASGATVPERIGIRWLTPGGSEVSITWSLVTLSASSSWHRISVAGAAPSGATQAQVLLSAMTPAAPNVINYFENVYLGLPIRTTGNLFGFGTESSEIDASGWTALVNATVSRQVPAFGWSYDFYLAGGHSIALTASAAGNASIGAVDRPTVTPGVEYLAYAYLNPPTTGSNTWIELRFYNSGGTQVQATRATLAPPGTGMYRQRVSAFAPATAATASVAVGIDSASAGQILRIDTVVITPITLSPAGTVLPYSDTSFEQGVGQWTTTSGVATLARTSPWGTGAEAYYALAITSTTATASVVRSGRYPLTGNTPGQSWRAQIYAHIGAGTWGPVGVRIRWYDASNTDLGTSSTVTYALPGPDWYVLYVDALPPSTATQAAVEVTVTASATSSVLHVDAVALWPALPLSSLQTHSDDGYIVLTLRELPVGQLVSVWRQLDDGSRTLVRGTSGLIYQQPITSDLMVIEDHEAPIGVPVSYYVEITQTSGPPATRSVGSVTLTLDDPNEAWLKDPGNPQRNMRVLVEKAPDWSRPIEQSASVVRGRRNKVILSDVRQGLEGDLSIWTRTDEERASLHLLIDSGNVLLWQAAPGMGVDDMYVNVGQTTEGRIGGPASEPWRAWTLPLTQADMPTTTGINGSGGRTWQDILAEFDTWADVRSEYATWEDVFLDRR
ncbi:hypothetical protein [Streptomyces sp. NPDC091299]|uniref:hypothetical protein n=1 Tax=Streptomyces sp. NPDC091299 TaxID=3155302 RepID=UPI0034416A05